MRIVKPRALRKGATIGIVAPSGPIHPDAFERGLEILKSAGFRVKLPPHVYDARGYLAGDDSFRADDVNAMFADPEVEGIICARGGYGAMRILHLLDYRLIRASRKPFAGYSDITAIHLAIAAKSGLVTFHSPVVEVREGTRVDSYSVSRLIAALTSTAPLGRLSNPETVEGAEAVPEMKVLRPGRRKRVRGRLIGGNLTIIAGLVGTPFEIDTRGRILIIEDVGEQPYRIDRMLCQLRLAGKLNGLAGVVIGEFVNCEPDRGKPTLTLEDVFLHYFGDLGIPVISGLCCGHGRYKLTFPQNVLAELDAEAGTVTVLEAAACER